MTRLNGLSRDEMWDVVRYARPDLSRDEFDAMWERNAALLREQKKQRSLN